MPRLEIIVTGAAIALPLAMAAVWIRFRRQVSSNRRALLAGSQVVQTPAGPIEVAETGSGHPVLVSHGGAGGYDQGLMTARAYLGPGLRGIAPSRFGHLRTPLMADSSAMAQADAYAALLDHLHLDRAAILGVSGGGPSALQFALRHPERCTALVLSAAVSQQVPARPVGIYASDFGFWLATTALRSIALRKIGVTKRDLARATAPEREVVGALLDRVHPIGLRRAGLLHDIAEWADPSRWDRDYPLEDIRVPTLVVHAVDDTVVPVSHAENSASRIPGARLFTVPSGGHVRLGQAARLREEITSFIEAHARSEV